MYTARIRMPRMGTSVHESTVVAWKKTVGDTVAKGEVLLSAESDKVEFEVEAPADGVPVAVTSRQRSVDSRRSSAVTWPSSSAWNTHCRA